MGHERVFPYKGHWLGKGERSPYWYIYWQARGSRRVYRRTTKTADLEVAKELLLGFVGGDIPARPEGPAWLRLEDALKLYAQHIRGRPSFPMVDWTCHQVLDFCRRHQITYASQFTLDRQDLYTAERRRQVIAHKGSVSNATINRELGIVRTAFHFAWKCGRLAHEPYVELLPEPPPRQRVLSLEECHRLLSVSQRWPHLHLFIKLALFTLQRKGALLRLTVDQVDLVRGRIAFHPPGEPVTTKRFATVPIAQSLWPDLAKAINDSQTGHIEYKGQPVASVKRALATASKLAGVKTVTPQGLRRTAASLLAGSGVSMREIAGMLGHSQLRTTERYAIHAPEYLTGAATTLDDLLGME